MRAVVVVVAFGLLVGPVAHPVPVPLPPVSGVVVQRFVAPACERCAGHRGVTIATTAGQSVVAVRDGAITFAGPVAGRIYVVQRISTNARVTYGWLESIDSRIAQGGQAVAGQVLGTVGDSMYLGVRIGRTYVEPLSYLGFWRVRLVGRGRSIVGSAAPPR